jgi:hypothetical protein
MLPANYAAIVGYLTAHGYTGIAAAGIAGNIYQESMGNPESVGSGGGGLIGWTPLPVGFVTGNPAADLRRGRRLRAVTSAQFPPCAGCLIRASVTMPELHARYRRKWGIWPMHRGASPVEAEDIAICDCEESGMAKFMDVRLAASPTEPGKRSPPRPDHPWRLAHSR